MTVFKGMINKSRDWGLRRKILSSMVTPLLLLGLTIFLVTRVILFKTLKEQFLDKGINHARSIASNSLVDILTQNTTRLKKLVENEKKLDKDTAWIFIMDPAGRILAHTFTAGFPTGLIKANNISPEAVSKTRLLDTRMGLIYDIAAPVLLDKGIVAQVRVGILQNNIHKAIMAVNLMILGATLLIIIIGVFWALGISALITRPISELAEATRSIQKGDFSAKIDIKTKDEIGLLADAFNKMAAYLNQLIAEVARLSKYQEREKIAFDLHDNCAQDLADLIKRLELCEKLFKAEPLKAYEEIRALKENIRLHLGKARQIIHGLKLPREDGPGLVESIKEFVDLYQKENDIAVKLCVSESVNNNNPIDKEKNIFYIIKEALTNIRKHSQAKNVELRLDYNGQNELSIFINDDGKGFDVKEAGTPASGYGKWGLESIRQRAISLGGSSEITSAPHHGTQILVKVPLSITYRKG